MINKILWEPMKICLLVPCSLSIPLSFLHALISTLPFRLFVPRPYGFHILEFPALFAILMTLFHSPLTTLLYIIFFCASLFLSLRLHPLHLSVLSLSLPLSLFIVTAARSLHSGSHSTVLLRRCVHPNFEHPCFS